MVKHLICNEESRVRFSPGPQRRVRIVDYCAALEMRLGRNPLGGSNPPPSALRPAQCKPGRGIIKCGTYIYFFAIRKLFMSAFQITPEIGFQNTELENRFLQKSFLILNLSIVNSGQVNIKPLCERSRSRDGRTQRSKC